MANRMDNAVELVVGLLIAGLLGSLLLPIAIDNIANTDTSTWGSDEVTIWNLLPVMIILAIFLLFVGWAVTVYRGRTR